MKNFSLGLICGLSAGLILSFVKDKDGKRLGQPLKDGYEEGIDEAQNLSNSIDKAKDASQRLKENLPAAEESINDIAQDAQDYQNHTQRIVDNMNERTKKMQNKLDENLTADDKKN